MNERAVQSTPNPPALSTRALDNLPSNRRKILEHLKREDAATSDAIAANLGITASATRQHLAALTADGLIQFERERTGPGRPTHRYSLTTAGDALFPRNYVDLTNELLGYIEDEDSELLARVDALMRRSAHALSKDQYRFDNFTVDFRKAELRRDGRVIPMSAKELQLLRYFVEHPDAAVSRDELLREVWGYDVVPSSRTVDVHVAGLRQKLEKDPRNPELISTVVGLGYRFTGRGVRPV